MSVMLCNSSQQSVLVVQSDSKKGSRLRHPFSSDEKRAKRKNRYKAIDSESFLLMASSFFIFFHLIEMILGISIDLTITEPKLDKYTLILEAVYEAVLILLNIALLLGTWNRHRAGLVAWMGAVPPLLFVNLAWRCYRLYVYTWNELVEVIIDAFNIVAYVFVWPKVKAFNEDRHVVRNRREADKDTDSIEEETVSERSPA